MTEELAKRIVKDYNKIMKHLYSKHQTHYAMNDIRCVTDDEWSFMWEEIYPYIEYCEEAWLAFLDNNESLKELLLTPYIGTFCKYGVLKEMYLNLINFEHRDIRMRERLIYENREFIGKYAKVPEPWKINFTGYSIEFYKNDGKYGEDYPTEAQRRKIINLISEKLKKIAKNDKLLYNL